MFVRILIAVLALVACDDGEAPVDAECPDAHIAPADEDAVRDGATPDGAPDVAALDGAEPDCPPRDGAMPDGPAPDGSAADGRAPDDDAAADGAQPDGPGPDDGVALEWVARKVLGEEEGLNGPDGLIAIGGARVLLANEVGQQVLEIDVDARTVEVRVPRGVGLRAPEEVALGPDGTLYVSDDSAHEVFRVTDDGLEAVLTAEDGLQSPEGIAVAPDGSLYVGDERARIIGKRHPDGRFEILADQEDGIWAPEGLALAPDGTLYATDDVRGGVFAVDPDGTPRVFLTPDELARPEGVAVAPSGDLWFTDNGNGQATLQRFDSDGAHLDTIEMPVPAGRLAGIAVLPDGRLVVSVFYSRQTHELWVVAREPMG